MIEFILSLALVVGGVSASPQAKHVSTQNVMTIEGDVLTGFSLPPYGVLCEDTPVRGGPDVDIYAPLYVLPAGEVVRLLEQPITNHRDWVMIESARWIPLSALCE